MAEGNRMYRILRKGASFEYFRNLSLTLRSLFVEDYQQIVDRKGTSRLIVKNKKRKPKCVLGE
jgi:hypothetical protein